MPLTQIIVVFSIGFIVLFILAISIIYLIINSKKVNSDSKALNVNSTKSNLMYYKNKYYYPPNTSSKTINKSQHIRPNTSREIYFDPKSRKYYVFRRDLK
jgi:uncharacterized protein YpmB